MDKTLGALIAVAIVGLCFGLMLWGWRARASRAKSILVEAGLPEPGAVGFDIFYVATTRADNFFERVSVPEFAYRGYGVLFVGRDAIVCQLTTGANLNIPVDSFRGTQRTTTVIDKVVEKNGLYTILWNAQTRGGSDLELATHVRLVRNTESAKLGAALNSFGESAASHELSVTNQDK